MYAISGKRVAGALDDSDVVGDECLPFHQRYRSGNGVGLGAGANRVGWWSQTYHAPHCVHVEFELQCSGQLYCDVFVFVFCSGYDAPEFPLCDQDHNCHSFLKRRVMDIWLGFPTRKGGRDMGWDFTKQSRVFVGFVGLRLGAAGDGELWLST